MSKSDSKKRALGAETTSAAKRRTWDAGSTPHPSREPTTPAVERELWEETPPQSRPYAEYVAQASSSSASAIHSASSSRSPHGSPPQASSSSSRMSFAGSPSAARTPSRAAASPGVGMGRDPAVPQGYGRLRSVQTHSATTLMSTSTIRITIIRLGYESGDIIVASDMTIATMTGSYDM